MLEDFILYLSKYNTISTVSSTQIAVSIIACVYLYIFYIIISILYPLVFPTVIKYPWPVIHSLSVSADDVTTKPQKQQQQQQRHATTTTTTAVFAGSFHPIHNGHVRMIQYIASQLQHGSTGSSNNSNKCKYDRIIIVIGSNPKKQYTVSAQQRAALIRKIIRTSSIIPSKVQSHIFVQIVSNDYIWRIIKRQTTNATFIRGIRTWKMDGKEERLLQISNIWGPILYGPLQYPIPTIYIESIPQYQYISSTLIRNTILEYSATIRTCTNDDTDKDDDVNQRLKHQVLYTKLRDMIPECIIEDVIQLYSVGSTVSTGNSAIDTLLRTLQQMNNNNNIATTNSSTTANAAMTTTPTTTTRTTLDSINETTTDDDESSFTSPPLTPEERKNL